MKYESSSNRLTSIFNPGDEYINHPKTSEYTTNDNSSELRCSYYYIKDSSSLLRKGDYKPGELFVIKNKDEDQRRTYNFIDKQGRQVLIRQFNGNETSDTYFIYENKGNLICILPPMVKDITSNIDKYGYQYRYDRFNRCTLKKTPGNLPNVYVYDKSDQLIFEQTGAQVSKGEWTAHIYDELGREAITGTCIITNKIDLNYVTVKCHYSSPEKGVMNSGYEIDNFPYEFTSLLKVNYYDNYDFITNKELKYHLADFISCYGSNIRDSRYINQKNENISARGMLTGTKTAILGTNKMLTSAFYYNSDGLVVQSREENHLNGYDNNLYTYSFSGKTLLNIHLSSTNYNTPDYNIYSEIYNYSYCHTFDDLASVTYRYNGGHLITLSNNEYDDFRRLKFDDYTMYTYDMHNRLTKIDNPSVNFKQQLYYTDGVSNPCYNGNISSMTWRTSSDNNTRGYRYTYDELDNLINAEYGEGDLINENQNRYNENITSYDKQGNILGLKRYGQTGINSYGIIDNLSFTYNGNQLEKVTDNAINSVYGTGFDFKNKTNVDKQYSYDRNGNLTMDLNKDIASIQYNVLNLPEKIKFKDESTITYLYNADGVKLQCIHQIGNKVIKSDYCKNIYYENDTINKVLTGTGYIGFIDFEPIYYKYIKDYQGNIRMVVDQYKEVKEVNHYYPFGGLFSEGQSSQPYKYNGKELDTTNGLNWYDYGARQYDATIGRWQAVDPMSEQRISITPYSYCQNNPIMRIDPNGMLDDWYKKENGEIWYDPKVKSGKDIKDEEKYLGATFKENDGTLYRSDGSILFKNEVKAYNRMWNQANRVNKEQFAVIGNKNVLVLPDYLNDNTTSEVESYGYSFKNSKLMDPVTKSLFTVLGTIHTHQDNLGGKHGYIAPPGIDDHKYFARKTPNIPYMTMAYDGNVYARVANIYYRQDIILPKGYNKVSDLLKGVSLRLLLNTQK